MWAHGLTPGACGWLCNGQCHRTWEAQFERTEIRWTTWIENPRRRWRRVAHNATSVNAQRIVGNNIGGLHPSIGVHVCTKFSWLNYFDGFIVAAAKRQPRFSIALFSMEKFQEIFLGRRTNCLILHWRRQWWSKLFVCFLLWFVRLQWWFFQLLFALLMRSLKFCHFQAYSFFKVIFIQINSFICIFNYGFIVIHLQLSNFVFRFVWNFRCFFFTKFHEK